jgi:hypothetical protein
MSKPPHSDTFATLPTAMQPFDGKNIVRYVKTPAWSGDTAADWERPCSLDFEQSEMRSERYAGQAMLPTGQPVPPDFLVMHFATLAHQLWEQVHDGLTSSRYVLDVNVAQGLTLDYHPPTNLVTLTFAGKAWPCVPGVTVPKLVTTW